MNIYFQITVLVLLVISFLADRRKTISALRTAFKKLSAMLPVFITAMIFTSLVLAFTTENFIAEVLGNKADKFLAAGSAALIGSLAVMPGFIAFPLGSVLIEKGVSFMTVSAFTTTLMMVGIITFPVEKSFLGTKTALIRNLAFFLIALLTALITGFAYGELI